MDSSVDMELKKFKRVVLAGLGLLFLFIIVFSSLKIIPYW